MKYYIVTPIQPYLSKPYIYYYFAHLVYFSLVITEVFKLEYESSKSFQFSSNRTDCKQCRGLDSLASFSFIQFPLFLFPYLYELFRGLQLFLVSPLHLVSQNFSTLVSLAYSPSYIFLVWFAETTIPIRWDFFLLVNKNFALAFVLNLVILLHHKIIEDLCVSFSITDSSLCIDVYTNPFTQAECNASPNFFYAVL